MFDLMLAKRRIDGRSIEGYDTGEYTHAAVAAYVASGMADTGFGIETPAERFGLDFIALVKERYFFLCPEEMLDSPTINRTLTILRSIEFRRAVDKLPGYDAKGCGQVFQLSAAFPALKARRQ